MSNLTTPRAASGSYGRLLGSAVAVAALMAFGAAHAAADDAKASMERTEKKTEKAVSDSWITTKVKSELLANSASKGLKVHVKTKNGVVWLKGNLPTQDSIDLVKMIAGKVKGVNSVDTSGLTKAG